MKHLLEGAAEDWRHGGFGLYLHWPFCTSKCPYCDFNSHVRDGVDQRRWGAAFVREIGRAATATQGRVVNTVFFGGGTPSLMEPDTVAGLMEEVGRRWRLADDLEVTLEANPGSVDSGRFRGFRDAGVNRLSIGVQSLRDDGLRALGRLHDAASARRAVEAAQAHFERVSIDLIYARQNQSPEEWRDELVEAIALGTRHLSLYQLTIEDGTAFGDRFRRGRLPNLPGEETQIRLYDTTQEVCAAAGLAAYEISNHARPGEAARHNLIYWRSGDYLGIGPGAHGRVTLGGTRLATLQHRDPMAWLSAAESTPGATSQREALSDGDRIAEFILMGLRLDSGISLQRLEALGGVLPERALEELCTLHLVEIDDADRVLRVTDRGRLLLDRITSQLLSE